MFENLKCGKCILKGLYAWSGWVANHRKCAEDCGNFWSVTIQKLNEAEFCQSTWSWATTQLFVVSTEINYRIPIERNGPVKSPSGVKGLWMWNTTKKDLNNSSPLIQIVYGRIKSQKLTLFLTGGSSEAFMFLILFN